MNKVTLIGRLTADPDHRAGDNSLARFTVAVDRRGGEENATDYIQCVAFGKTADNIGRYFYKGKPIAVEGAIRVNSYTDKDGNRRSSVNVAVSNFEFLPSEPKQKPVATAPDEFEELDDADIPF